MCYLMCGDGDAVDVQSGRLSGQERVVATSLHYGSDWQFLRGNLIYENDRLQSCSSWDCRKNFEVLASW